MQFERDRAEGPSRGGTQCGPCSTGFASSVVDPERTIDVKAIRVEVTQVTTDSDHSPPQEPGTDTGPAGSSTNPTQLRFRRFLLAVQPGESNPRVWAIAGDLVGAGAEGIVCHVVMRSTTAAANGADGSPANAEELAVNQELRSRLIANLGAKAREIPIRILHGDAGERICEYAEFARCDLIVLGTRAKPSLGKLARGSVSKYLAGNSRRSVLLIGD
jgi:nucleotide-binding universal stress UspA family protein